MVAVPERQLQHPVAPHLNGFSCERGTLQEPSCLRKGGGTSPIRNRREVEERGGQEAL